MKAEAVRRMEFLHLHVNAIASFRDKDKLYLSEGGGTLFWLTDEQKKYVAAFEGESGGVVYHVIRSMTNFGEMLSMLYVSKREEDWEDDRKLLQDGYTIAYVENVSAPDCSELGAITISSRFGGLVRIL